MTIERAVEILRGDQNLYEAAVWREALDAVLTKVSVTARVVIAVEAWCQQLAWDYADHECGGLRRGLCRLCDAQADSIKKRLDPLLSQEKAPLEGDLKWMKTRRNEELHTLLAVIKERDLLMGLARLILGVPQPTPAQIEAKMAELIAEQAARGYGTER